MEDNMAPQGPGGLAVVAKLVGAVFVLFAVLFSAPNLVSAVQDRMLLASGAKTVGTVTDAEILGSRSRTTAHKTVEFKASDSQIYIAQGRERYNSFRDGERQEYIESLMGNELTVSYDPVDPDRNVVEGSPASLAAPVLSLTLLGGIGCYLLFFYGKKIRQDDTSANHRGSA